MCVFAIKDERRNNTLQQCRFFNIDLITVTYVIFIQPTVTRYIVAMAIINDDSMITHFQQFNLIQFVFYVNDIYIIETRKAWAV